MIEIGGVGRSSFQEKMTSTVQSEENLFGSTQNRCVKHVIGEWCGKLCMVVSKRKEIYRRDSVDGRTTIMGVVDGREL